MKGATSGPGTSGARLLQALNAALPGQQLRLLLACSGGSDSVALAMTVKESGHYFAIAHVNHGLRGPDSDEDADFVQQLAAQLGAPFHLLTISPERWNAKDSLQAQARQFRYEFFDSLLESAQYDYCLLAHHQDDQSEQLLLSLFRGNQPRLFAPIPARRDRYLRPFLSIPKSVCISALEEAGQPWREDASNQSTDYLRNKLRLELLPALEGVFPAASLQLLERADWHRQQWDLLEALLDPLIGQACRFRNGVHTCNWSTLPELVVKEHLFAFLVMVLNRWGWHGHALWQGAKLAMAGAGAKVEWEGTLVRGRNEVQWIPEYEAEAVDIQVNVLPWTGDWAGRPVQISLEDTPEVFSRGEMWLNPAAGTWPLTLGPVQTGDRMSALGMKGAKLLSDVMIDCKFSPAQKQRAATLRDAGGRVLWLSDFRIAELAKVIPGQGQSIRLVIGEAD